MAGSERVKVTGARGKRLEESKKINQSLSALGNVIVFLIKRMKDRQVHIPYRNSKLTRLLEDSLGGNCITTFMGMISPGQENFSESLSTLKFANRTKKIKNKPKINEELDQELLIKKYEDELKRLRRVMAERRKVMGQSKLLQLEEERERAEAHRDQMMRKLQEESQKFLEEREEKRKLQIQISHLESEVDRYKKMKKELRPGDWVHDEDGDGLRGIEERLKELEEQKGHVVEYKDLLKRQRDIMVALTGKLSDRDEAIMQLQDELEAFDKIYFECEQLMSTKNAQLDYLSMRLAQRGLSMAELLEGFDEFEMDQKGDEGGESASEQEKRGRMRDNLRQLDLAPREEAGSKIQGEVGPGQMKTRIDMIIDELAEKKNGDQLERVAKDLLGLQKMIGAFWERQIPREAPSGEREAKEGQGVESAERTQEAPQGPAEEPEKFVLNRPESDSKKTRVEQRYSEKPTREEVDMRQINYESLFEKDKLIRKQTEDGIDNTVAKPGPERPEKSQTYEDILSKFEEIKTSLLHFNRKGANKENTETQAEATPKRSVKKKQTRRSKRRPNSQIFRESKTRAENVQRKRAMGSKKDSFSQSRQRNKSFSSSKFGGEPKSAKKRTRGKVGSFLTRKSGNFNEVNSKLQSILNSGKRNGYLENKYIGRAHCTEKRVEGLLRDNNILNLMPKTPHLK